MRIGTLKTLCAAAVAVALALPAAAQVAGQRVQQPGTARPGQAPAAPDGAIIEEGQPIERGTRTANFPPGQEGQAQGQLNDQALVRWISAGNEAEIRVNEFAQQQAENDQVKQFAQKMVQEHTKMGDKLRQAAQGGGADQPGATDRPRTRRPSAEGASDATPRRRPGAENRPADDNSVSFLQDEPRTRGAAGEARAGGAARGAGNPFLSLHEEIKRQCAESAIAALREKQGADFDHAFMHCQVFEHMGMLDTLKVAQQRASENLKPALQEAQQHTQQHLEEAKQILEQLEKQ